MTSSGASSATTSGSTIERSRIVTPSRSISLVSHSVMAPMSDRCGAVAAIATWPPRRRVASWRWTSWPRSAAVRAASSPAGPPPTTSTRLRTGGRPMARSSPSSPRAAATLTTHDSVPVVIKLPTQPKFEPMHGRIRCSSPVAGLVDERGVGDEGPHHRHHVGAAAGDDVLGVVERHDPADDDRRLCRRRG